MYIDQWWIKYLTSFFQEVVVSIDEVSHQWSHRFTTGFSRFLWLLDFMRNFVIIENQLERRNYLLKYELLMGVIRREANGREQQTFMNLRTKSSDCSFEKEPFFCRELDARCWQRGGAGRSKPEQPQASPPQQLLLTANGNPSRVPLPRAAWSSRSLQCLQGIYTP